MSDIILTDQFNKKTKVLKLNTDNTKPIPTLEELINIIKNSQNTPKLTRNFTLNEIKNTK
jgi:broad-specificity NMP kinase